MMIRVLLVVGAIGLVYWYWVQGMPPARRRIAHRNAALFALGGVLVVLALTGRAHWLFGLLGGLLPFARRLAMGLLQAKAMSWLAGLVSGGSAGSAKAGAAGQTSEVATEMLRMTLDHASGRIGGEVLRGRFAGRRLEELAFDDLLALLEECRTGDPQGAALLESYLEREHAERWAGASAPGHDETPPPPSIDFSEAEARQILGVDADADADAIRDAHRRLIQRLHPDRGGSPYLAAQINRAKELLLDTLRGR
ncbi:MAG: DnaJ domain-containing protein [Gammaproteobacteria bacterium]|nr:DnaJ domain-containing protein [Gammaproteobacteria bacterium]